MHPYAQNALINLPHLQAILAAIAGVLALLLLSQHARDRLVRHLTDTATADQDASPWSVWLNEVRIGQLDDAHYRQLRQGVWADWMTWAEQGVRLFGQCVRWALHASVRSVVIIVLAPVALLALDPPSFATAIEHWHTSTIEDQSRAVRALFAFFIGLQLLGGAMLFALTNRHSLRKRSFNRALRNAGAAIFAVDSGGGQSPRSMTHGKSFS